MKVILQVLEQNTDGITSFSFFSAEDQSQILYMLERSLPLSYSSVTNNAFHKQSV